MIRQHTIFTGALLKNLVVCCILSFFLQTSFAQVTREIADSVTVSIAKEYDEVSSFHRFVLGESYRKLWAEPVRIKVFHLEKEKGGLTITQRGGGLQTKSLRLKDAQGREWVLRTIQKYPEQGLPEKLRKTIAKDILQDQVVTGHPYAALTVPPFAKALDIPHANPQIVFVPDDPALGSYRGDFANSVLLFEEREPDSLKTDNSEKAQSKLQEDNDTRIEQKLVLRARLLDLLLGDWDRHEDQWRWEKKKEKNATVYLPLPRDRDKVFYNTSGVLPWLLSHQWLKSNLQGFHEDIRDIAGYNFNNRYFDRYFLTAMSEDDWKEQIQYVQQKITDSLIRSSIKLLPPNIYDLSGEQIINTLIARRSILLKEALNYYRFISRYIDVPASDKHELFEIKHGANGHLDLTIYKTKKDHTKDKVIYRRDFDPAITKEIRLYGFAGNDVFSVTGTEKSPIKVRMIGGDDVDSFYVDPLLHSRSTLVVYDRFGENNKLPARGQAAIRISTDSTVNTFDKRSFKYDQFGPALLIQYNLDQGFQYRAGIRYQKHGFRKEPYAARHELFGNYSTVRASFLFTYEGDIRKFIGQNDLTVNILSRGPHNVSNFYGIGNETSFIRTEDKGISYYRNRYDYVNGDVRLKRNLVKNFTINAGLAAQYYTSSSENNRRRFLNDYNFLYPEDKVFANRFYAGVAMGLSYKTRKDEMLLHKKGVYWNVDARAMQQLNGEEKSYGQVTTEFDFYIPVFNDTNIIIANRFGAGTTIGKPAFFQQMQLGGVRNLRGFHSIRFTGKSMVYNNVELRVKLFDFTSFLLPGTVGLIGFNDVGRVWVPGESSNKWHDGYGGGLYIIPADYVLIQAVIGHSIEGTQPFITIGMQF
ncbi:MAG: hypothetical protein JWQ40_4518 [Segetibacter sp.]|nr:hypothetical protein [Segetibacter sp.]